MTPTTLEGLPRVASAPGAGDARERLVRLLSSFLNTVAVRLPDDVLARVRELAERETGRYGRLVYGAVLENLELALRARAPLCQDTGVLEFYVTLGEDFPFKAALLRAIGEAVVESTRRGYLRPNVVDPVSGRNTGDNTGPRVPWVELELEPGADHADVRVYMAGGGSSRPGRATVLDPARGWRGVVEFVVDVVAEYGPQACPPLVVGVGVGATIEVAASLSKRALLRPLGSRNGDQRVAALEELLEEELNKLGIGPQGLGGATSVMGVHVEYAGRHPATLAVAVSLSCWALRRGWIRIRRDLSYELLSHRGGLVE